VSRCTEPADEERRLPDEALVAVEQHLEGGRSWAVVRDEMLTE
jgi:hypothetical protein